MSSANQATPSRSPRKNEFGGQRNAELGHAGRVQERLLLGAEHRHPQLGQEDHPTTRRGPRRRQPRRVLAPVGGAVDGFGGIDLGGGNRGGRHGRGYSAAGPGVHSCAPGADHRYSRPEGWRWAGPSPNRSGPEGSSRNEFRTGSSSSLPPSRSRRLMEPPLPPAAYRVLARAHRPTRLSALIGQEALVRTLKNAFASGRIAHAFLLSGIRGVGKTTTARIIARGLNCTGPDGQGGPTPEPCGVCPSCVAIDEGRAVDVIEMDAASQTGKEDVRELLEGLQFLPGFARYKVYILDEVHMLSSSAWNALLKTVEEPPPHAKFVFATTEVRKVPITVLSRCQKFELRRVEPERLAEHLAEICATEGVAAGPEALAVIARVAEGSVRDALSLLDQAIATAEGPIDAALVQGMLGLADRVQLLDLFDTVIQGDPGGALERFAELYARGADPVAVAQDLLEISHWLSRLKVAPEATSSLGVGSAATERAAGMARDLGLPVLARAWQMLLRGIDEIRTAPDARAAAEMLLLRLACVADLPSPAELARLARSTNGGGTVAVPLRSMTGAVAGATPAHAHPAAAAPQPVVAEPVATGAAERGGAGRLPRLRRPPPRQRRGTPGRLAAAERAPDPLRAGTARAALRRRSAGQRRRPHRRGGRPHSRPALGGGPRRREGEATLADQAAAAKRTRMAELARDPALQEVLAAFPGAELVDIRRRAE